MHRDNLFQILSDSVPNLSKLLPSIVLAAGLATGCQAGSQHESFQHGTVTPVRFTKSIQRTDITETNLGAQVIDLNALLSVEEIIPRLAGKRVIFVGEVHNDFSHHLNQLEIIRGLHAINPNIAIGVEFFQQPFQQHLDSYIAGALDDRGLLTRTEYFARWRYDYRFYQPILQYAREHAIPLVALNVAQEIVDKVSNGGLESLDEQERAQVPEDIDRTDQRYRERLAEAFEHHPGAEEKDFERFMEVQLLWDESMADRAAHYLENNPERVLIVLAGNGHIAYGSGIPARLARRVEMESVIVVNGEGSGVGPDVADYVLVPSARMLPPPGRLGVLLESPSQGVRVGSLVQNGAAEDAGMKKGDWIEALDGAPVNTMQDVKIAMWDKQPGEQVSVRVRRTGWLSGTKALTFDVELR